MEQDLLVRGLSPLTQEAYIRAVVGLTTYYGRAPDTLSAQEVQAYLASLVRERGLAWSTLNVTVHFTALGHGKGMILDGGGVQGLVHGEKVLQDARGHTIGD